MRRRPSQLEAWPRPFDREVELDWGDPVASRRLLREHLDQAHDGASRRAPAIRRHVRRLLHLLPPPPADILDAASGPGLYSVPLAQAGHRVTALDVGPASIAHARRLAARLGVTDRVVARRGDLRTLADSAAYDAAVLVYHVLEAFPRPEQARVLRRLRGALREGGLLVVEMRLRPDQPPGRVTSWDVVPRSLLSDRRHLLLVETVHETRGNTFVLRETAIFDDGRTATQQTSSALSSLAGIPRLFARGGFAVTAIHDRWTRMAATPFSESVLVVARRR